MATGTKMSFNPYQNGKYDSFLQTSQKDVEISQDLHLKMSKKIAQLTKVIYALNTKNDESESVLQTLRDQHEEQIQQILADTKQKLSLYKDRLDEESDYHATMEALQAKVAEYEAKQASVQDKFSLYKAQVKDQQEKEQETHLSRVLRLTQEVMKVKENFEDHLNSFKFWREKIAAEHAVSLAELERKHQTTLEDLRDTQRNQDNDYVSEYIEKETELKQTIEDLKMKIAILESDKMRLEENHTVKLNEAVEFYKKELEAACSSKTQMYKTEIEKLRKEIDVLKSNYDSGNKELKIHIDHLIKQLAETEAELTQDKQKLHLLEGELANRSSSTSDVAKQLHDLKEELSKRTLFLENVESELAQSKQQCSNLAIELVEKSSKLDDLASSNNQKDDIITCQQSDIEKLTAQVRKLDIERISLLAQQQSLTSDQRNALTVLQQALKDLSLEKETLQVRSQKQIESFQQQIIKQTQQHSEELDKKLEEAHQKYLEGLDVERRNAAEELNSLKQELTTFHKAELNHVAQQRDFLQTELNHVKADLTSRILASESEVARLQKLARDSEEGLGSASKQLNSLKDLASELRAEIYKTQSELSVSNTKVTELQMNRGKIVKRIYKSILENPYRCCTGCEEQQPNQLAHSCLLPEEEMIADQLYMTLVDHTAHEDLVALTSNYVRRHVLQYSQLARRRRAEYNANRPFLNEREDPTDYWRDFFDSPREQADTRNANAAVAEEPDNQAGTSRTVAASSTTSHAVTTTAPVAVAEEVVFTTLGTNTLCDDTQPWNADSDDEDKSITSAAVPGTQPPPRTLSLRGLYNPPVAILDHTGEDDDSESQAIRWPSIEAQRWEWDWDEL